MKHFKLLLTAIGLLSCMGIHAYEYVDLGLPSGTLWATTNIGATSESDYGSYFAWGETTTKTTYSQANYTLASGITAEGQWNASLMTKYTSSDGNTTLASTDDAATVVCGSTWVTPTTAQFQELIDHCTWSVEGNGYRVSGNGKSIFLPFAGYKYDGQGASGTHNAASDGYYMANSVNTSGYGEGNILSIASGSKAVSNYSRFYGISVRPVSTTKVERGSQSEYNITVTADDSKSIIHMTIGEDNLANVTKLTITGSINSYDLMIMRNKMPNLKELDLHDATIETCSYEYYTGYSSVKDVLTSYSMPENVLKLIIPSTIKQIDADVLSRCKKVQSIIIPSAVKEIKEKAFWSNTSIEEVIFEDNSNLEKIGYWAFAGCSSLRQINIEKTIITEIPKGLFEQCRALESLTIPQTVTCIKDCAFYAAYLINFNLADSDTPITIDPLVDNPDRSPFYANGKKLKNVYIGRNIIGCNVFKETCVEHVTISSHVTNIPEKSFYKSSLATIDGDLSNIESIGEEAFYGCKVQSFTFSNKIKEISKGAFRACNLAEIVIPANITSIGSYAFADCTGLTKVTMPTNSQIATISTYAFSGCSSLEKMDLPISVTTIGAYAFQKCSSMTEVRLPSSITSIGNYAFNGCSALNDVYTYTPVPQSIDQNTFSTYTTATLHIPAQSYYDYYYDTQWSQFLKLENFDEPYTFVPVNGKDYTIYSDQAYYKGNPDAEITDGGSITINGDQPQNFSDITLKGDVETTIPSLIGNDANLTAANVYVDINVTANKWYFFCFPYDVDLTKIQKEGSYIFRKYDGDKRAANGYGSGWQDLLDNKLNAGEGYIFRTNKAGLLSIKFEAPNLNGTNVSTTLVAHDNGTTTNENKNWNFSGNRYISYYEINDLDYTAPIITWDNTTSSYVAYRPGDDDYTLAPFQAFFVQKPNSVESVGFDKSCRTTYLKDQKAKENNANGAKSSAKARKAAKLNRDRELINITISDGTNTDKTRIVFNEKQSTGYEMECDASKFVSADAVAQVYSLDVDGVKYSINERPKMNGDVQLGFVARQDGKYTFAATRMDIPAYIKDNETGKTYDLSEGYTFTTKAGTYDNRFVLTLNSGTEANGINNISAKDIDSDAIIYDLAGHRVNNVTRGVFIVNGKKMYVK